MIEKEKLQDYARKLMFEMNDEEYLTLQKEFDVILKQMEFIEKIPNIKEVKPMSFPFITYEAKLREDVTKDSDTLTIGEVLANTKHQVQDQVKVPKVVE